MQSPAKSWNPPTPTHALVYAFHPIPRRELVVAAIIGLVAGYVAYWVAVYAITGLYVRRAFDGWFSDGEFSDAWWIREPAFRIETYGSAVVIGLLVAWVVWSMRTARRRFHRQFIG